ncbi:CLUMA_CG008831, isoform A [Clunio marinus]|uniref:CLUMA_CG008831, isoform A n=1 Tax=Clunio marinus TaxID=568069 RepID=A0A1J1I6K9_9DIPT|nr:CLUMA_CG008831, isoform A [Clunio marinus]
MEEMSKETRGCDPRMAVSRVKTICNVISPISVKLRQLLTDVHLILIRLRIWQALRWTYLGARKEFQHNLQTASKHLKRTLFVYCNVGHRIVSTASLKQGVSSEKSANDHNVEAGPGGWDIIGSASFQRNVESEKRTWRHTPGPGGQQSQLVNMKKSFS